MRRSGLRGDRGDAAGGRSRNKATKYGSASLFRRKRGAGGGGGDGGWRRRRRAAEDGRRSRHSSDSRSSRTELRTFLASSPLEGASPFEASSPLEESSPLTGASPFGADPRSARRRGLWGLKPRRKWRSASPAAGPTRRRKRRGLGLLAVAGTLGAAMGYGAADSEQFSVPAGGGQSPSERTAQFVSAGGLLTPPLPVSAAGSAPSLVRRSWSSGGGQPARPVQRAARRPAHWPTGGYRRRYIYRCAAPAAPLVPQSPVARFICSIYPPRAAAFVWGDGCQSDDDTDGAVAGGDGGPSAP